MANSDTDNSQTRQRRRFATGDLIVNTGTQQVTKNGETVALPKLSYQLLVILVETAPNVVTQDELSNRVWPGRSVGHDTITQRIRLLRRALGDDAPTPRYVELVRGEGARWLPEVVVLSPSASSTTTNLFRELGRPRALNRPYTCLNAV